LTNKGIKKSAEKRIASMLRNGREMTIEEIHQAMPEISIYTLRHVVSEMKLAGKIESYRREPPRGHHIDKRIGRVVYRKSSEITSHFKQ